MKQKNITSDALTKKDLLETKRDLLDAFKNFRIEMKEEFEASERRVLAKVAIKFADMEHYIDDRIREGTSELHARFDAWAGTIDDIRTDQTMTNKQVDNHEKRITKLEHN